MNRWLASGMLALLCAAALYSQAPAAPAAKKAPPPELPTVEQVLAHYVRAWAANRPSTNSIPAS